MKYYKNPNDVLFYNPTVRFLAKIFGSKYFVQRCKECKQIPTEMYGEYCQEHIKK